jgi:hypothetical protein
MDRIVTFPKMTSVMARHRSLTKLSTPTEPGKVTLTFVPPARRYRAIPTI